MRGFWIYKRIVKSPEGHFAQNFIYSEKDGEYNQRWYYIEITPIFMASVSVMALGAYWYSPYGFGHAWEALAKPKNINAKIGFAAGFVLNLIMAAVLSMLMTGIHGPVAGIVMGLWLWVGFIAPTTLMMVFWEGRSIKLWLLDNSYHVVSMVMMGAIIGGWV